MFKLKKNILCLTLCMAILLQPSFAMAYDRQSLIYEIYQNATAMNTKFTVDYYGTINNMGDVETALLEALSYDDYLRSLDDAYGYQMTKSLSDNEIGMSQVAVDLIWLSSREQENVVDQYVEDQLKALKLEGLSDYHRAFKILEFIDQTFTYDKELKIYDAYTMIQTKKGVCQAYSELYYKMLQGAALEVENQEGQITGNHLWNLVKIGDNWFHADATNSHASDNYFLFLKGNQTLRNEGFSWTQLDKPVADSNLSPDQSVTTGNYLESTIRERLLSKEMPLTLSEEGNKAKVAYELFLKSQEATLAYEAQLQEAMTLFQHLENPKTYKVLSDLVAKSSNQEGVLELAAYSILLSAADKNNDRMSDYYQNYYNSRAKLTTIKDESSALKVIKLGKDTIAKIKAETYYDIDINNYLTNIQMNNSGVANNLCLFYISNVQKTKNKVLKAKALAIAKEYNLKDLYAKALKLKVK